MDDIKKELPLDTPETEPDVDIVSEKPDFVKTIESFDVHNLTPENIEFMTNVIQDYFREYFPVRPDLLDQLPSRIVVQNADSYRKTHESIEDNPKIDISEMTGFYNSKLNKIFINADIHETAGSLFSTMFHESLHFVSVGNGAGFSGGHYLCPDVINETDELYTLVGIGQHTLSEGTTQIITLRSVLGDMGFDEHEQMFGYGPEIEIMNTIWQPIDTSEMLHAYFEMSMEDLRIHIESILKLNEDNEEIDDGEPNGLFAGSLVNLGEAMNYLEEALNNENPKKDLAEIFTDARHAVGYYIVRRHKANNIPLSQEEIERFNDYLEPFINEEKENV
ncbi:hypothetical protein J6V85_00955 [Candidatus Saccharibacteria bacterium]|nr:hypothetical protein [Candidatus Saccharibacteria bacterium]